MIVLIALEPNPPRAMPDFIETLELNSMHWRLLLRNVWATQPTGTVRELYSELKQHLGKKDMLFITKITSDHAGWLSNEAGEWLSAANRYGLFRS